MLQPINPWRELEREDYVIASAVKGTAQCGACLSKIAKGAVQVRERVMHATAAAAVEECPRFHYTYLYTQRWRARDTLPSRRRH